MRTAIRMALTFSTFVLLGFLFSSCADKACPTYTVYKVNRDKGLATNRSIYDNYKPNSLKMNKNTASSSRAINKNW
ncbi:hypothetical protein QWY31_03505 [Cytophagales bacterium LB-30]|uniref:Lipoprotein n=1 Tax=Shiella aurantiaca TaxID=3058365 RepID=A0ABT8F284_9BACT|nr:hypothetical protein [Shiella aurantiaca]MDN4164551.1 hypothetical protein [Shiella aurantiaca]